MKTTHREIEITYDEKDNRWHFELRGRQRSAESLLKAKEHIDKPVTEKEEKTFKPVAIWLWKYSGDPVKGTITSIAESGWRSGQFVWVKAGDNRSKENVTECYPDNENTATAIAKWKDAMKQACELRDRADELKASLKPITID